MPNGVLVCQINTIILTLKMRSIIDLEVVIMRRPLLICLITTIHTLIVRPSSYRVSRC